jgi:cyanate permease
MDLFWFTIATLGVWRITHLIANEDGPFQLVARLRKVAGTGFWGSLMDCFYCLSVWIAAPFSLALAESWSKRLLLWPALSGAAILINEWRPVRPQYFETPAEKERHL